MKILHIFDHSIPLHSGYTFRSAAILREQRARGWETFHLTSPKQISCEVPEEEVDGLRFFRTPKPTGTLATKPVAGELLFIRRLTERIVEVARQVKPDVLHAHSPVLNAIPAIRAGRKLNIPVVYEIRAFWEDAAADHGTGKEWGLRYRVTRALETWAVRNADAVTTICDGLRGDLVRRGLPADKTTVIPNAVDVEKFSVGNAPDEALKTSLGLTGKRVLGFIGSFYAYEGLDLLLEALPLILRQAADVRVLLTGGGPMDAQLKEQAARLGIGDKVVFTGRVPHHDVTRYYDLVDVLVYPRKSMRLTELVTPLKPLEAMAQGRLLAASDVGGHRELIHDNETGVLFRANDSADLAAEVLALLAAPHRWPELRSNARRFVETERNWPASVARYEDVYGRVLKRG